MNLLEEPEDEKDEDEEEEDKEGDEAEEEQEDKAEEEDEEERGDDVLIVNSNCLSNWILWMLFVINDLKPFEQSISSKNNTTLK